MNDRNLLAHARALVIAGELSVIPIRRGTKLPALAPDQLATYMERRPTDAELHDWFASDEHQHELGILGGPVSGNLCVFNLAHPSLWPLLKEALPTQLAQRLPVVETWRGHHVYIRMEDPPGHGVVAELSGVVRLSETRGTGCWVVAPPSLHPEGKPYTLAQGSLLNIPLLEDHDVRTIFQTASFGDLFLDLFSLKYDGLAAVALTVDGVALLDRWGQPHAGPLSFEHVGSVQRYLYRWGDVLALVQNVRSEHPTTNLTPVAEANNQQFNVRNTSVAHTGDLATTEAPAH